MHNQTKFWNLKYLIVLFIFLSMVLVACSQTSTIIETTSTDINETTTTTEIDACSYDMSIEISNGQDEIEAEYVPCLQYTEEYTADGFCTIYDLVDNFENLPSIAQTENMNITKGFNLNISLIEIFNSEGALIDAWDSWEERVILERGQYYIKLHVIVSESNCFISGHSIFVLIAD